MGYVNDFNPVCSECGLVLSCDDIANPEAAPLCDECAKEEQNKNITIKSTGQAGDLGVSQETQWVLIKNHANFVRGLGKTQIRLISRHRNMPVQLNIY